jgi:hypothetical protein
MPALPTCMIVSQPSAVGAPAPPGAAEINFIDERGGDGRKLAGFFGRVGSTIATLDLFLARVRIVPLDTSP